jgi:hypothetical protein
MRNACPTCQTVYAVTPADVGRRITCTRCNANLVIDEDGFRLAEGTGGSKSVPPPPPRAADEPGERRRSSRRARLDDDAEPRKEPAEDEPKARRRGRGKDDDEDDDDDDPPKPSVNAGELFRKYVDVPTAVFAVGVVVVLWFLFMPIINAAGARWYTARVEDEQLAHDDEMKRLKEKGPADGVTKEDERWRKRKEVLDASVVKAGIHARQSEYWDRFGLLGGFVLTALGSIGLLMSHQPLVKKVLGGVVVAAMLLMVFYEFTTK